MPAPRRASSTPSGLLAAALLLAPALWLFAGPLWQNEAPAFRDTADYYLPLWARAQAEWNAGRIPWFNPWENGGQPLAGDVTAAAFYPGRLLFCLPLSFARTLMLFLMLHILLAAFGAAAAARMLGASREASWIAGPVFAYSGYVLAQHANAVYLVGAAWLPWAAAAGWLLVRRRRLAAIPLLAGPLAMMILGGDPQTAANLVLLLMLAIIAVYLPHSKRKMLSGEAALPSKSGLFLRPIQALAAFGLAGATCGLLAAVQLAPTAAIGPQAERSYYTHPRSIWEPQHAQVAGAEERTWWNPPRAGEHADSLYDFSLPPWLLAEFALPNAAGRMIPENHRWTSALPFSDRVWAMSLYLGLPALWLAWIGFLPFRGSAASRWLAWGAVLSAVASFGWYGLGWLTGEGLAALGQEAAADKIDPAAGGLYWMLVRFVPGYVLFRYPAKLFLFTTFCLALLAARGYDRLKQRRGKRVWLPLALAGSASLLAALAFPLSGGASWFAPLADARDNVFGSLQTDGAARDVTWAFVQAGVAALAAVLLIWGYRNARISIFFIALITADLLAANSWLVQTAPFERWQSASLAADTIREHASERPDPIRVFRAAEEQWLPIQWRRTSSSNRLEELLAWNRDTLYPKHNLTEPIALVETLGSAGRYDWQLALAIARENGPKRTDGRREPPREFLDLLGAEYFILPPEFSYPGSSPLPYPAADSWAAKHSRVWHNPHARPIAWIVHETSVLPQLTSRDPHRIAERTRNVLFSESPDWRRMAVVEADDVMPIDTSEAASECRVLEFEPGRLVIEVDSPSNGWLVVSHAFDPAWQAEAVETDGTTVKVPLYRTNRLLLGAPIPAGRTTLNLTFRPTGNYTAGIVSASAWGLWGLVIAAMLLRHARRRREIAGRRS